MRSILYHRGETRDLSSEDWLSTFCSCGFSAAIFDCDGTLVESSEAHMRCMQAAALEQGHEIAESWYLARTGLDRRSLFQEFRNAVEPAFDVERARLTSIAEFAAFAGLVRPIESVLSFAAILKERKVPLAVASNAERSVVELSLSTVGAKRLFNPLVSICDVVKPKPSPEVFELAAKHLGRPRNEVLVIEDSPQGVEAAKGAGMSVVQLVQDERLF